MSSSTIRLPNRPSIPWWPRWFQRRRLLTFFDEVASCADEFVAAAQREQREYRPRCFTVYVSKRLDEQQKQLVKKYKQLKNSFQRSPTDIEAWLKGARDLQPIVTGMRDSREFDEDIRRRCDVQEKIFFELESIANRYAGESRRELKRKLEWFRQQRRELTSRRQREDVIGVLRDMEATTESTKRLLATFEGIRDRAQAAVHDAEQIDCRLLNASPESAKRYQDASMFIGLAQQAIQKGDFGTAGVLCRRTDELLKDIREDLDKLKRYATTELNEWHEYLTKGSTLSSMFLAEIESLREHVDGQAVTRWKQLRPSMESPILSRAEAARLRNRAIAKRSNNSLFAALDDLMDPERLESFAKGVGAKARKAFKIQHPA